MNITAIMIGGASLTALGLAGALWWQSGRVDALRDDNAALTRSVAALTAEREQAALARDVARAEAKRQADRAAAANAAVEALLTGDFSDAPLDPRITDLLECLRSGRGDCLLAPTDRPGPP